jgi:ABC-type methionine transport system ATPase subunit
LGSSDQAVVMRGVVREVADATRADRTVRLLDEVDLEVARGGLLHVVGPSGAGKSTLIRLINRMDEATDGSIEVLGRSISSWPVRELRQRVAMAFQESSLLGMSVRENLRLRFDFCKDLPADVDERMAAVLDLVGLEAKVLARDASQISVGQKQRVALARALIGRPDVVLLDEPTSGLDPRLAEQLLDRLTTIRREQNLTMVMVTHRLEEARRMGGEMAVMIDGRVEAHGPVEAVITQTTHERVRQFLLGDGDASG